MSPEQKKNIILIVDDTPENLDVLKGILIDEYIVRPAINGPLALRLASMSPQPDLILLDIMMPEMDGFEVCRQLKQNPNTQNIPVIFVTAKSGELDELEGLEIGAVDYIIKPISPAIVKTRVKSQLVIRNFHKDIEEKNRRLYEINEQLTSSMEQLTASEDRFRSLMQTIPDIVYKIDAEGKFTFLNKSIERLGYHQSDLIGKHFSTIIHSTNIENVSRDKVIEKIGEGTNNPEQKLFDERRTGDRMTVGLEVRLKAKSGKKAEFVEIKNIEQSPFNVEVNSTGLYGDVITEDSYRSRQYIGTVGVIRDITERQKVTKELIKAKQMAEDMALKAENASQAKGDFLANMSHEIRTPLNAVIGLTYLCLQTKLTTQQQDYLNKVNMSANSLLLLLNDILDFSKIEAGKLSMEKADFNLDEVLSGLSAILSIKSQEKKVELLIDTQQNVPHRLNGDSYRLGQVLLNLADNAIKFTESGEIIVRTELVEEYDDDFVLKFSVQDTGIGMTVEQVNNIFQEFTQADASTTRKYGGTGLGLTISKCLVEMMDGKLNVTSKEHKGSCFSFTARFGNVANQEIQALPPIEDIRILIVDDNDNAQNITTNVVNVLNCHVAAVESGKKALQALSTADKKGTPFDLVIMDWKMPEMDGLQTSQQIKTALSLSRVPKIIMLTAYSRYDVLPVEARQKFLDGFLMKPIDRIVLINTIMTIFGHTTSDNHSLESSKKSLTFSLAGTKLLLVEDNEINQQVVRELLEQQQIQVTIAANGLQAIELVANKEFDVVLMDRHMPVMNGLEATKKIRLEKSPTELPIIALTANVMADDRKISLDVGMNDHIGKPVVPDELYTTLSKWVKKKTASTLPLQTKPLDFVQTSNDIVPIPTLAGIDVAIGLRNVGENSTLYTELLFLFVRNQGGAIQQMELFLSQGDAKALEHIAHTLKGVSSSIGAIQLAELAGKIEQITKEPHGLEEVPSLLNKTNNELMKIILNIETRLEKKESSSILCKQQDVKAEQLTPLFKQAIALLKEFDSDVEKVVKEIALLVSSKARLNKLQAINKALDNFDFEMALTLFQEWAKIEESNKMEKVQ